MLYQLEGKIAELNPEFAVVDCGGIGYEVYITPNTASALRTGEISRLYISEAIGEDHFDLYGFLTQSEKRFYKLLISVSGIGPKAAMSILSYNTPDSLAAAIVNGNEASLTACPGIGKKTAQRVILELKDKIARESAGADGSAVIPQTTGASYDEALAALSLLGYSTTDVVPILKQIKTEGMTSEQIIKAVLKYMI